MREDLHMPYVPFVFGTVLKGGDLCMKVECPRCGESIVCREMKDFETFTQREFAEHYTQKRDKCGECGQQLTAHSGCLPLYCINCAEG